MSPSSFFLHKQQQQQYHLLQPKTMMMMARREAATSNADYTDDVEDDEGGKQQHHHQPEEDHLVSFNLDFFSSLPTTPNLILAANIIALLVSLTLLVITIYTLVLSHTEAVFKACGGQGLWIYLAIRLCAGYLLTPLLLCLCEGGPLLMALVYVMRLFPSNQTFQIFPSSRFQTELLPALCVVLPALACLITLFAIGMYYSTQAMSIDLCKSALTEAASPPFSSCPMLAIMGLVFASIDGLCLLVLCCGAACCSCGYCFVQGEY